MKKKNKKKSNTKAIVSNASENTESSVLKEEVSGNTEIIDISNIDNSSNSEKSFDNVIENALSFNDVKKHDNKKWFFIGGPCLLFCLLFLLYYFVFRSTITFKVDEPNYSVDVFSEFSVPNVIACYGNRIKCKNIDVTFDSNVDTSKLGDYRVVYSANYKKKKKDYVVNVSVVDHEAPIIEAASDSLSVCPNSTEFNIDYSANDNYDGDLTSSVSKTVIDDVLNLSVSDSSNNIGSKDISLIREDLEGPSISINGNVNTYLQVGSSYSDKGAIANDNCDGDVSSNISFSGGVDTSKVGSYSIVYSVTDSAGNSSSLTRNVYVYGSNGSGDKVVYLTFDDGPSAYTGELLDILARYNVKATFFVTNRNPSYNHFIKRAYEEGHTIALHTSSHNYSRVYSSVDAYFEDLNEINETVKNITGSYSYLIRFPGGSSNTVSRNYSIGIMSTLSQMVTDKGYKYFDWNVSSSDADGRSHPSSEYANNIINGINGKSMSIVLQHDTNVNSIRSVGTVIEYGLSHGYTFKPLDMTSPVVHHKIAN